MSPQPNPPMIDDYLVNASTDIPDIRDWPYEPALIRLRGEVDPPTGLKILDQGQEGACTGFGLAAVINCLNRLRDRSVEVSPRMLYEMAKLYDEWEGEYYSGSSCRGAIKGWHHMGVCEESDWPYRADRPGLLTLDRAEKARANTIGAYYRLQHRISDFHAALNEVEAIYVSARVHTGWRTSSITDGRIPHERDIIGGHAFAVVGYNSEGFWVQNSWGTGWGDNGLALWSYEDWLENVKDAWVLRLALPTPQIWHLPATPAGGSEEQEAASRSPGRAEIAGHFVHIDDGHFHESGKYWSSSQDVRITADLLAGSSKYDHLLFYAHGGLNSINSSARRIRSMKEVFKENRIYPYHFMYDTGIMEELKDVILRKRSHSVDRVGGVSDASDWLLEKLTRIPGRALWREMKQGAESPFARKSGAGSRVLEIFLDRLSQRESPLEIHVVGHSTGGILAAYLLARLAVTANATRIASVSLMAPAATVALFDANYAPLLQQTGQAFGLDRMQVLNLNERLELDDNVGQVYRKSLLYLVSRAFEEEKRTALLGMQKYSKNIPANGSLSFIYSDGSSATEGRSTSEAHGGFDNDVATMNQILGFVLGAQPKKPFTKEDLSY